MCLRSHCKHLKLIEAPVSFGLASYKTSFNALHIYSVCAIRMYLSPSSFVPGEGVSPSTGEGRQRAAGETAGRGGGAGY